MALKDRLKGWLEGEAEKEAPERYKLATRLLKEADDEESAGFLNQMLDKLTEKGGK